MTTIKYEIDGKEIDVEVSQEFAKAYSEMEKQDSLIERKETRRHQSLDKLLDMGFDFEDLFSIDKEIKDDKFNKELWAAVDQLSVKQKKIFLSYALKNKSFQIIAEEMGISKSSVVIYFRRAQKKIKNILGLGVIRNAFFVAI